MVSRDRRYRYHLARRWAAGASVCFLMLNPSTADAETDDATIRRCVAFARRWGYAALEVVNLFALRSPSPRALLEARDPIGPENDAYVRAALGRSALVVAAWGALAVAERRAAEIASTTGLPRLHCLGITTHGAPRHPLFVRARTRPRSYQTSFAPRTRSS